MLLSYSTVGDHDKRLRNDLKEGNWDEQATISIENLGIGQ